MIDEEIRAALDVDPSPEFVARVRTRIARRGRAFGVAMVVGTGDRLCAGCVRHRWWSIVSRPQTRPSTSVAGAAVAAQRKPARE